MQINNHICRYDYVYYLQQFHQLCDTAGNMQSSEMLCKKKQMGGGQILMPSGLNLYDIVVFAVKEKLLGV